MSRILFQPEFKRMQMRVRSRVRGALVVAFCLTLMGADAGCVKLPRRVRVLRSESDTAAQPTSNDAPRININTATPAELERLPGIGPSLAARIIEQRTRYGPFRRVEHLLIIPGISERRFAEMRPYIKIE
jgi:competence protein ComEA